VRIAFVGPVPPIRGGIPQHAARLIETLREEGHEVEVVSWGAQYPRFLYKGPQVDPSAERFPNASFPLRWWSPLSWWNAGRRARRAELLVFTWVTPFHAVPLRIVLAAAGRTPSVAIVHNPLPHEPMPFARALTRWVLGRADRCLVHAKSSAAELAELVPGASIDTVPMPSLLKIEPTELPPRPPLRLLFLGFVRPYKGLDIALEAQRVLVEKGEDISLTVAGEFWEPVEVWQERVSRAGLTDRVNLQPGYASDDRLRELLRTHHILVAPYRSATQSGVIPIAIAAGRPVVATNVGGLAEQVRDSIDGAVIAPDDPQAFGAGIERVGRALEELAAGARQRADAWGAVATLLTRSVNTDSA